MTNYYARIVKTGNNRLLVKKLKEAGKKVVVVTNFPYVEGTTAEADAVICNFSGTPDSIRAAVELLFGKIKPCAQDQAAHQARRRQKDGPDEGPACAARGHPLDLSYC